MNQAQETTSFFLYNTMCTISLLAGECDCSQALRAAEAEAEAVRRLLDYYDADSSIGALNHCAGCGFTEVPEALYVFLRELVNMAALSGGGMDPTIGPLTDLWNFTAENPAVPTDEAIHEAMEAVGYNRIRFDSEEKRISLLTANMRIDAGASGKGYAVDRVTERLIRMGVTRAYVNFGGNIRTIGARDDGDTPWVIGLQKPWGELGECIGRFRMRDEAVATSGGYDRYFCIDGETYSHLLDPRTGKPAKSGYLSTTVVAKTALIADVMSTAFFVIGEEKGAAMLKELDSSAAYLLVNADASFTVSDGMRERLAVN